MTMSDSQVNNGSSESQTLQDRLRCLKELSDFTADCQDQLDELFDTLGWKQDYEEASAQEAMEVCPHYSNHRVPSRTMERHKAACLLRKMGYSREEQAEMVDSSVCYEKTSISCFTMDTHTQQQVIIQARGGAPPLRTERQYSQGEYSREVPDVPQNHKRAICDLTVADRLALYDHVTQEARQRREQAGTANNEDLYVDLVAKLKKGENQDGPKSHLELMAEMRDYKRRRQSYRAKNVHITKKSYTEVIREVIGVHSGELSRQWRDERDEEREEEKPGDSRRHSHRRPEDRQTSVTTDGRRSPMATERRRSPMATESRRSSMATEDRRSPMTTEGKRSPMATESRRSSMTTEDRRSPMTTEGKRSSRETGDRRSPSAESRLSHLGSRDRHASHRKRHRSRERSRERSKERSRERSREKERKKKRKRDSRSPDERHHDKKKKKKKKKDEKERGEKREEKKEVKEEEEEEEKEVKEN